MALSLLVTCALLVALPGACDDDEDGPSSGTTAPPSQRASESLDQAAARRALDAGLAYLARRQSETVDGSLPTEGSERAPVGVTALGALAFMAAGNLPERGPFGKQVARAIDYLLEHTDLAPASDTYGYISSGSDLKSRTHGHGFATLALAQAHGMSPRRSLRVGRALEAAVRLIETSQGVEGGWEYEPRAIAAHEGSVTICHVQALRSARNSGVRVDADVIHRAEDYVVRLQKDDGTFKYKLDMDQSSVALTAAAIATLNMAGRYDDRIIQSGIDAIWSGLALQEENANRVKFPFYQRLYVAQALWQLSDTRQFERWFADERRRLLRSQEPDGNWRGPVYGDTYATAMNCLVLAMPEGLLPIFQR
jgi:hypothetical protein